MARKRKFDSFLAAASQLESDRGQAALTAMERVAEAIKEVGHPYDEFTQAQGEQCMREAIQALYDDGEEHASDLTFQLGEYAERAFKKAAKVSAVKKDESAVSVKRAKDFHETGNYEISLPNGTIKRIYRDPENGWWYLDAPGHYADNCVGFTKKEAVARVVTGRR